MASRWLLTIVLLLCMSLNVAKPMLEGATRHHKHRHHGKNHDSSMIDDFNFATFPAHLINKTKLQQFKDSGCTSCIEREGAKYIWLDSFLSEILKKLGMDANNTPRISADDRVRNSEPIQKILKKVGHGGFGGMMRDEPFDESNEEEEDVTTANLQELFSFAREPPASFNFASDLETAYFNLTDETKKNVAKEAELLLYLKPSVENGESYLKTLFINVYRRTKDGKLHKKPSATQKLKLDARGGWVSMNVTEIVANWFHHPKHNHGIFVECLLNGRNLALHPQIEQFKMYLKVKTAPRPRPSRTRRFLQEQTCFEEQNISTCCRYHLDIDFREIGWDWVIAPTTYKAYFCNGDCPASHLQRYIHTHLTSGRGASSCCHPTSLSSLTMVHLDHKGDVLVSNVPGMTAKTCGCA